MPKDADICAAEPYPAEQAQSVVFYGTSITHGPVPRVRECAIRRSWGGVWNAKR